MYLILYLSILNDHHIITIYFVIGVRGSLTGVRYKTYCHLTTHNYLTDYEVNVLSPLCISRIGLEIEIQFFDCNFHFMVYR